MGIPFWQLIVCVIKSDTMIHLREIPKENQKVTMFNDFFFRETQQLAIPEISMKQTNDPVHIKILQYSLNS